MKKTLFSIVISLLFCSCMPPSVSRMIMKTYPPTDSTDYYYTAKGVTVGLYYGADMEYKFSKHLAATLGVGWMSASLSDFEIDNNGQREFVDLMYEQGVREGVGFCNFALGLRYHF